MAAAVHQLDRILATEPIDGAGVCINANIVLRRRLSFHDGATPEMRFEADQMRRHQRNDRLIQPDRGLGSQICVAHQCLVLILNYTHKIDNQHSNVKAVAIMASHHLTQPDHDACARLIRRWRYSAVKTVQMEGE